MDSEIGNIEAAESERLLSGNVVKPHIYGSKEPVCSCVKVEFATCFFLNLSFVCSFYLFVCLFVLHS